MPDRAEICAVLPRACQRLFHAIEQAIGDGTAARLSNLELLEAGVGAKTIVNYMPVLVEVGLLEVEIGPQRSRVYRLSNAWRARDLAAVEASIRARGLKPAGGGGPRVCSAMRAR